jgi:ribosomal protein L40E
MMGFFDRLNPINAKISVTLEKTTFMEGEPITGRVNLDSDEAVRADEIRLEVLVTESHYTTRTTYVNGRVSHNTVRETKVLHSEKVRVSGPLDIMKGQVEAFPFSFSTPPAWPSMPGGTIDRRLKGVVAVKGRPDKTGETNFNVSGPAYGAATAAPAQVMVKEVVKVPCKYCGALNPIEYNRCTNCGATFTK